MWDSVISNPSFAVLVWICHMFNTYLHRLLFLPYCWSSRLVIGFGNHKDKKKGHMADCFFFSIHIVTSIWDTTTASSTHVASSEIQVRIKS